MTTTKAPKLVMLREKHLVYFKNSKTKKSVRYNLKERSMQRLNRKRTAWDNVETQYAFFRNFSFSDLECEEEKFLELIQKSKMLNRQCTSVSSFVSRLNDAIVYENYIAQGIEAECRPSYYRNGDGEILSEPLEFYSKNTIKYFKEHKVEVTCTLERKFKFNYDFYDQLVNKLLDSDFTSEEIKKINQCIFGRNSRNFVNLVDNLGYDVMGLLKFCMGYLIPFENLDLWDSLELLNDYYSMASRIGRNVKRYPKYLKSMHDIITSNYNAYKQEYDEILFKELMRSDLAFEGKVFCIAVPKSSKDIVSEGTNLNHCVGSYVDKILKKETYIFFLRDVKEPDKSLITLELKEDQIVQAKGSYNRTLLKEERKFLNQYAKKMKLEVTA